MDPLTAGLQLALGIVELYGKLLDGADAPTRAKLAEMYAEDLAIFRSLFGKLIPKAG